MNILVLNCGSSSLKYELFSYPKMNSEAAGLVDRIGQNDHTANHEKAVQLALTQIEAAGFPLETIKTIGHRVVHGGEKYTAPTKITAPVLNQIQKLCKLAPLHNPPNLAGIKACQKLLPKRPQVAVFDTSFHQTMPEKAYLYALPYSLYKKNGIRRYGFHGTSHSYVSKQTQKLLKKSGTKNNQKNSKIITVHLGNGSSLAAIKNGKSIDTSMGYTPLEGIPMGTRSGSIDPAIPLILQKELNKKPEQIDHLLNKESGLKGISNLSSDMRDLWAASNGKNKTKKAKAKRAMSHLSYNIAKTIAAYSAALQGLDAITFTGGLGEKAYYIRAEVCSYLPHLGLTIDTRKNKSNQTRIHKTNSKIKVFVIPTDEEKEIATETAKLLLKK